MRTNKHNTRRAFVAWLLLVLFMLPVVVKAVHVCQVHTNTESGNARVQGHDADNCSICHFAFLTFDKVEDVVLGTLVAVAVIVAPFFFKAQYRFEGVTAVSLRGPPQRF